MVLYRAALNDACRLAGLCLLLVAIATTAFAQGVTGTLAGTVKDQQGGVVPGATVTVISQTQGTKSAPVVTNATGDFVIPNIAADTYTIRVEMPSFKTLNRTDVQVSPGSRDVDRHADDRRRRHDRGRHGHGRVAPHPGDDR